MRVLVNTLLALIAFAFSAPLSADEQTTTYDLSIEAQALPGALKSFAEQTDLQVVYFAAVAEGKDAPAIDGEYTAVEALDQLLANADLEVQSVDSRTYSIAAEASSVERGNSDSKNSSLVPILMVQNQTSQTQTNDNTTTIEGVGSVTGKVIDARTGSSLKGAKITLVDTGRWTSTGELGEFRFANVPNGVYVISASYLGYTGISTQISVNGDTSLESIVLRGGSEFEEIVVYGSRSARAQSLNQERTAPNSTTVLSADFLGQFDGTTIAETLRRAPGVAFEQNSTTGDGSNIIIRGLDPDFNQITLNGLRLPEGSGVGRSADLGSILTESISKVTISKTLLPSQDSSGAGGLVEIETKTPLDRPRRYASFSAQISDRDNDFLDERQYSAVLSGTFGASDQFGLSASAQLVDSSVKRLSYQTNYQLGPYLPLSSSGQPISLPAFVDPRQPFPFEPGVADLYPSNANSIFSGADTENLTLTISAAWNVAEHTSLNADFTSAEVRQDAFDRQVILSQSFGYELLPIQELGGEVRGAFVVEDSIAQFGFPGIYLTPSHSYSFVRDDQNDTRVASLRGETVLNNWSFNYNLGYANGETYTPLGGQLSFNAPFGTPFDPTFLNTSVSNDLVDGRIVSVFAPSNGTNGYVLPSINQAGFDSLNDSSSYLISQSSTNRNQSGENERISASFSTRFNFDNDHVKYLEFGVYYEQAEFSNLGLIRAEADFLVPLAAVPIGDLGLAFSEESLGDIGLTNGFRVIDRSQFEEFALGASQLAETDSNFFLFSSPGLNRELASQQFTKENDLELYLQTKVDIGNLEVVGGVRVDHIQIEARNLSVNTLFDENGVFDPDFSARSLQLVDNKATQTEILPRVVATYRLDDNMLLRAGFSQSIARPQIQFLSSQQTVNLNLQPAQGPLGNQPILTVSSGNPDLQPSKTTNIDLGMEFYFENVGQLEISAFYKEFDNLLETNSRLSLDSLDGVVLPDDPAFDSLPDNLIVATSIPVNNPRAARIWGLEAVFEKQLTFLPGALGGLGVIANYTYTDSKKTQPFNFIDPDTLQARTVDLAGVRFANDPTHSGTAALTYNRYGIDAALSYTSQGRRLGTVNSFRLDSFDESYDTLDFRAEYRLDKFYGTWRFWIFGSDLLRDSGEPSIESSIGGVVGTPKAFTGASFFGGREITLGVSSTF